MSEYRDLADLLERVASDGFNKLKSSYPGAGRLFASSIEMGTAPGGPGPAAPAPDAAREYAELGLGTLKGQAQKLIDTLARRIRRARTVKFVGALVAMVSSAGLAASTLSFIVIGESTANLILSGVAFTGAATTAFSDSIGQGAGRADAVGLLHEVAEVRGSIGRAEFALGAAKNGLGVSYMDVLKDLNDCAFALEKVAPLVGR